MRTEGLLSFLITGNPFSKKELADVRAEISFAEAIDAHLAWKARLVEALGGSKDRLPDVADVSTDTRCALGQWIHGAGHERYGGLPSFAELRAQHAHFHDIAGQVLELTRADKKAEAKHLLEGPFQRSSTAIIARIERLGTLFGS